jgi:hypothetical protein
MGTQMALTSTSTYAEALAQYLDNLSWEGDVTKARAALEAIRFLQVHRPVSHRAADGRGGDYEAMESTRRSIEKYLALHDTANQPRTSFVRARPIND